MRKTYVEGKLEIAWGYDRNFSGFFVQVFNENDDLVTEFDQSAVLTGMKMAEPITHEKMVEILTQHSEKALKDFYEFEKEPLEITLRGYIQNAEGFHNGDTILKTYGDYFAFLDKVEKHYTITDEFDCLIVKR